MSLFINQNNGPVYNDCTVTIINGQTKVETVKQPEPQTEEVQPEPVAMPSNLFTKKAKQEDRIEAIIQALRESLSRRNDKARALVEKVRLWQKEGYIDPNYNARVMYDELNRILTLPFQYGGFRKYYNK